MASQIEVPPVFRKELTQEKSVDYSFNVSIDVHQHQWRSMHTYGTQQTSIDTTRHPGDNQRTVIEHKEHL